MVRLALNWTTVPEQMVCMDGTLGLTDGLWSHGQTGTQLDHSSRTDGMYRWNTLNWTTVPEQMVCMDGTEQR
jgi:hypothetical protein